MDDRKRTRVILADDHNIVRKGLRSLIESELDLEVVGEANNGRQTVQLALDLNPDLIIMDISMPDLNGIEATRQIISRRPKTKVLGLSMHSDKRFVAGILKAGASGYLLKDCAFEEMATAIDGVINGGTYISPAVAGAVIKDYLRRLADTDLAAVSLLSNREIEVLQMLAEGKTTREVAGLLNLSIKTIETHRRQIMDKLDIHSIAELTKYAVREGITSLE